MSEQRRWKDLFVRQPRVRSQAGDFEKEEFIGRYDDRGHLCLEPTGKTNLYEFIQSFADSVDINIIMSKAQNGDPTVLSRVQGVYADISDMPKTMADLLNKVKAGEDAFNDLDVDIRAAFNHSLSEWMATAGTAEWCEKMGLEYIAPEPKKSRKKKVDPVLEPVPAPVEGGED